MDSGASRHMVNRAELFSSLKPYHEDITVANGEETRVTHKGTVVFKVEYKGVLFRIALSEVLFVPGLDYNLMSVSQQNAKRVEVSFKDGGCIMSFDGRPISQAVLSGKLFRLKTTWLKGTPEEAN